MTDLTDDSLTALLAACDDYDERDRAPIQSLVAEVRRRRETAAALTREFTTATKGWDLAARVVEAALEWEKSAEVDPNDPDAMKLIETRNADLAARLADWKVDAPPRLDDDALDRLVDGDVTLLREAIAEIRAERVRATLARDREAWLADWRRAARVWKTQNRDLLARVNALEKALTEAVGGWHELCGRAADPDTVREDLARINALLQVALDAVSLR